MIHKLHNPLERCNLKFDSEEGIFEGFASVFGGNDAVNDTISKGAFTNTLKRDRAPLMLFQHNPNQVIGKWIGLAEDDEGLIAKGEFTPGHSLASDVRASAMHGAIDGLSIGFRIPKDGAEKKEEGGRTINEIDLVEISIVSMPADGAARISVVKAEIDDIESLREAELFLRDLGEFSRSTATAYVSRIQKLAQRDAAESVRDEITELKAKLSVKNSTESILDLIHKL
jgi:hypothetical protein